MITAAIMLAIGLWLVIRRPLSKEGHGSLRAEGVLGWLFIVISVVIAVGGVIGTG